MNNFVKGQKIKRIDDYSAGSDPKEEISMHKGGIYTVDRMSYGSVYVEGTPFGFDPDAFEVVAIKAGDEVTISVLVDGEVWEDFHGNLKVGDDWGFLVEESDVVSHRPAVVEPEYTAGERFSARQGANDVLAIYSPGTDPELPWLVVFSDGSYGHRALCDLTDLQPLDG